MNEQSQITLIKSQISLFSTWHNFLHSKLKGMSEPKKLNIQIVYLLQGDTEIKMDDFHQ